MLRAARGGPPDFYIEKPMKLPTTAEALFSLKTFAAAMLALYIALGMGLPRPFWAMMTAYIVSNPFSGAVRSKAAYRVGGTILGSVTAVLLVPSLANAPELLSLALALWVGACLYISLLDRTPRSYVFMLAGYTAALIGFPTVSEPAMIFDVALARVEEITLGITCATLVHSLVFPQGVGPVLLARMDASIHDVERWIQDALAGTDRAQTARDRRKLAGDITELRLMATHLPFDTSQLRWTSRSIHALQRKLAAMLPLLSSLEDRVRTLHALRGGVMPPGLLPLLDDIAAWSRASDGGRRGQEPVLLRRTAGIVPAIRDHADWEQLLLVNLSRHLLTLLETIQAYRKLRRGIGAGHGGADAEQDRMPSSPVLHLDHRLALMSGFAAAVAIAACCAFWIFSAWPVGAGAVMMASIFCCFFATQDDPVPAIKSFLIYSALSVPLSCAYVLGVLPSVHSFEMLLMASAPLFLAIGVYIHRPATSVRAFALLSGVVGMAALQDTGGADMTGIVNSSLAQLWGIGTAAVCTALFRSVSAEWTARRLLHAGWGELARLAVARMAPSAAAVSSRMLDRISLLTPRLALGGSQKHLAAIDALNDLRVGLGIIALLRLKDELPEGRLPLDTVLAAIAAHFQARHADRHGAPAPALLGLVDLALRDACVLADARRRLSAIAALVGIRRNLFPDAPPYEA